MTLEQWKCNFLTSLSLKAAYLIPRMAIRKSVVWLDEQAQNYAYELMLHDADENKRSGMAVKCVSNAGSK